jgi:hypothetical protein
MPVRFLACLTLIVLVFMTGSRAVAQSTANRPQSTKEAQASDDQDDVTAVKADLAKMRVLVTQMQNNLGLTTNTTTPLYHQFELEINMWQLVIARMERRIEHMERGKRSAGRE